jgi:hypothetical protein
MTYAERGMILDRDLNWDLLEVALRVAADDSEWSVKRKLLTVALRDRVSEQEAQGKTKKCLTRVWINPPGEAREMVNWGREHAHLAIDRRIMHLGALLATFPFVGAVMGITGRSLAIDGQVEPATVRKKVCALWGDRSSIDVGARKAYTTLLRLGVLTGGGALPLRRGDVLDANGEIATWLIHALLLTRGTSSVDEAELPAVPELFWVNVREPSRTYPWLERHNEGVRRTVWAPAPR